MARNDVDEWVLTVARDKVRPPLIPYVETVTDPGTGRPVTVVTVDVGYAVHAVWHNNHFSYFIRAGRQAREASPDELARLQQQQSSLRAELRPVSGTSLADLDMWRLHGYFGGIRGQETPENGDTKGWVRLLLATEFLTEGVERPVATVAGVALFGRRTERLLPQPGIDAVAYPGREKDYAAHERATLRGPLTPLLASPGNALVSPGLVDSAVDFVRRNIGVMAMLVDGTRRIEKPGLPVDVVQETLVNAVIHRDYLLAHTDVELGLYPDRLEVISPGRLTNGVTIEGMRLGVRAARNELLKDVMRDYGYLAHMGLGVPRKIIAGMRAHNGTDPTFAITDERFSVTLWR